MVGSVIRAAQLRPGDLFETLLTGAAGIRKPNRANGASIGIPVELWYTDGRESHARLHPLIWVRFMGQPGLN
jgi:hypothetical protein